MKSRVRVFVSGRVQGVFFRDFTRSNALSLGLNGWVRNLRDGRVEVLAEGEREALGKLIERLMRGPPAAIVHDVDVVWEEYRGEFSGFQIRWL